MIGEGRRGVFFEDNRVHRNEDRNGVGHVAGVVVVCPYCSGVVKGSSYAKHVGIACPAVPDDRKWLDIRGGLSRLAD